MDFLCGYCSLQFLTVQQSFLDLLERFTGLYELFCALSVSPTVAGGDKIGDTCRFVGERFRFSSGEEFDGEVGHLFQTDSKDGSFGVSSQTESVYHTGSERDDVLERSREGDTSDILNGVDSEVFVIENSVPEK